MPECPPPQARSSAPSTRSSVVFAEHPLAIIQPHRGLVGVNWAELWSCRDLLLLLAVRDIKVRYKQTAVGAAWALIQPLFTMLVFTAVFGILYGPGRQPSPEGIPYPISTFCALLPWQFFAHALTSSSNSLIDNERLIGKVYFPRLILPAASIVSGLLDFAISFTILLAMMLFYGIQPGLSILFLPVLVILSVMTALGLGLWLSALNALYRDIRYTVPFLTQLGMFITPVVYSAQNVLPKLPPWAQALYMVNPMAGVIEGFRWALLGTPAPPFHLLVIAILGVALLFLSGAFFFRRMERTFADWI